MKITFGKLLFVILIIGILGVFFDYANRIKNTLDSFRLQKQIDQKVEELTLKEWETYKSDKLGFTIKYPPFFYAKEELFNPENITFLHISLKDTSVSADIQPRIAIYKVDKSLEEAVKLSNEQRSKDQFPEFTQIDINGTKAFQTKATDPEVIFRHTIFGNDQKAYIIEVFTIEKENQALINTYEEMLKTFQLLE